MKILTYEFIDTNFISLNKVEDNLVEGLKTNYPNSTYNIKYYLGVPYINLNSTWGQDWHLKLEIYIENEKNISEEDR